MKWGVEWSEVGGGVSGVKWGVEWGEVGGGVG